jgi:hypothetical protein
MLSLYLVTSYFLSETHASSLMFSLNFILLFFHFISLLLLSSGLYPFLEKIICLSSCQYSSYISKSLYILKTLILTFLVLQPTVSTVSFFLAFFFSFVFILFSFSFLITLMMLSSSSSFLFALTSP